MLTIMLSMSNVASANVSSTPYPHDFKQGVFDLLDYNIKSHNFTESVIDNSVSTKSEMNSYSYKVTFLEPMHITGFYLNYFHRYESFTGSFLITDDLGNLYTKDLVFTDTFSEYVDVDFEGVLSVELKANRTGTNGRLEFREFELFGSVMLGDILNLSSSNTHDSVLLNWIRPSNISTTDKILIYQDGEKIKELAHNVSSNMINGLEPNTSYIFQVAIERADGTITDGDTVVVLTEEAPDDDVPPANITGLNATATENSITLNWTNPIDTDFSHVQIFRDGQLILPNLNDTTYTDAGLTSGTQYVYRIVSVDENGNSSSGVIQTVSTVAEEDNTPPATPQHITVSNGNKSGTVSWVHNLETDLAGYNLYVNGVKVNTGLILGNHYVLTNLDNSTDYNIELTAVDVSGNESDKSQALTITPDEQALPVVETKYDLKSVADGTASWFNGLWLILAFSVSIPLAFLIARRVKALIVGG